MLSPAFTEPIKKLSTVPWAFPLQHLPEINHIYFVITWLMVVLTLGNKHQKGRAYLSLLATMPLALHPVLP